MPLFSGPVQRVDTFTRRHGVVSDAPFQLALNFAGITQAQATALLTSDRWSTVRASSRTARAADGGVDLLGANVPRLIHSGAGVNLGYASFGPRTALGGGGLVTVGSPTITAFDASTYGDASAVDETINASTTWHRRQRSSYSVTAGVAYPFVFRFVPDGDNALLLLRDSTNSESHMRGALSTLGVTSENAGTIAGFSKTTLNTGEIEVRGVFTPTLTGTLQMGMGPYQNGIAASVNALGWNLFSGTAGEYIPEGSADVVVDGDGLTYDLTDQIGSSGYVVIECELSTSAPNFARVFEMRGAGSTRLFVYRSSSGGPIIVGAALADATSWVVTISGSGWNGSVRKLGVKWGPSGISTAIDGSAGGSDATAFTDALTTLDVGWSAPGGNFQLDGMIRSITVGDGDADIEALTA